MVGADLTDYYVLFPNHHEGLRLLKAMRAAGIRCAVSPTPRAASSCCGMSIRIDLDFLPAAQQVINDTRVNIERIVPLPRPSIDWKGTC